MKTAAVSRTDIWSWQGQVDHEMSPPAGSAISKSDQLQSRENMEKQQTFLEHQRSLALTLFSAVSKTNSAPTRHKDGDGFGAKVSSPNRGFLCLHLSKEPALQIPVRDPTIP